MAEGNQPNFVAENLEGGDGGDGRVNSCATVSGGAGDEASSTETQHSQHNKHEPPQKGFHQSSLVFEYGDGSKQFLTTNQVSQHSTTAGRLPLQDTSSARAATQRHTSFSLSESSPSVSSSMNTKGNTNRNSGFFLTSVPEATVLEENTSPVTYNESSAADTNSHGYPTNESEITQRTTISTSTNLLNTSSDDVSASTTSLASTADIISAGEQQQQRSSGVSQHRDREERLRQLREKQTQERQHKLEELKEHAASAQRFREQQEEQRRHRLQELRTRDQDRRSQVEERRKYMEQAEQQRREAFYRKNQVNEDSGEHDSRQETKRRNERSNIVFAFGSSTPRMLDPKETSTYWAARRATSISNVTLGVDGGSAGNRRSSDCVDHVAPSTTLAGAPDLARKRATSAQGLDRNPSDLRMSSSMYEVFHWTDGTASSTHTSTQGGDDVSASGRMLSSSVARRRTDLHPITPSLRDSVAAGSGKGRHRSPGGRSGVATPSSVTSRPSSALSQASSSAVQLRTRPSPRKPRPMSIGGSALSTADRPRSPANRESRPTLKNSSSGSSVSSVKSTSRAKSASTPTTPARTAAPRTPRRTPSQVKAESAAKKAAAKGATPKSGTPVASPGVENKSITATAAIKKTSSTTITKKSSVAEKQQKTSDFSFDEQKQQVNGHADVKTEDSSEGRTEEIVANVSSSADDGTEDVTVTEEIIEVITSTGENGDTSTTIETVTTSEVVSETTVTSTGEETKVISEAVTTAVSGEETQQPTPAVTTKTVEAQSQDSNQEESSPSKSNGTSETSAPISADVSKISRTNGDATLLEKVVPVSAKGISTPQKENTPPAESTTNGADRPVAGYATEDEYRAVLAEKRRLAREAKEREQELERQREEEEAERERQEEAEMLRLMEEQKKGEEERLKKAIEQADREREEEEIRKVEEEKQRVETERQEAERQREAEEKLRREEEERQSRKSRVAAIMARTRAAKGGATTPNKAESKTPSDEHRSINDVLSRANLTDSMIDKMSESMIDVMESEADSCAASSGISSAPVSDFSSQPGSDVSNPAIESDATLECETSGASSLEQTVRQENPQKHLGETGGIDLLTSTPATTNGNSPVPMDTESTQSVDLIGSLNGHSNGVDNSNSHQHSSVDLLGSFDPFTPSGGQQPSDPSSTVFSSTSSDFEQIIDASQTTLNNEDAINSNRPNAPFIAFEQNLNKKTTPENTSVPDILM